VPVGRGEEPHDHANDDQGDGELVKVRHGSPSVMHAVRTEPGEALLPVSAIM
jgi:hypothetical protein